METKHLKLTFNTKLFKGAMSNIVLYENLSCLNTYKFIDKILSLSPDITSKFTTTYEVFEDTEDLFLASIKFNDYIKVITANNRLSSFIFNCNHNTIFDKTHNFEDSTIYLLYESFYIGEHNEYKVVNKHYWKEFIENIYNITIKNNNHQWTEIKIPKYKVTYLDKPVKIYGGLDSNNNVLIGFNIYNKYDAFTGENNINKIKLPNHDYKLRLTIENQNYIFSNGEKKLDLLKLYILLHVRHVWHVCYNLSWIAVNNISIYDNVSNIIAFDKDNKYKIDIIAPSGDIINCGEIIDKISTKQYKAKQKIMGDEETYISYGNINLYRNIPSIFKSIFKNRDMERYDYIIEII